MRRPSNSSVPQLSTDSRRLAALTLAMLEAGSRVEERSWEHHLDALLQKLLSHNHQDTVDAALDHLLKTQPPAYELLMESIEAVSASCTMEQDGTCYEALLVAMPVLAWTRFVIASGSIPADTVKALSSHLRTHILATDVKLVIAPTLFSIDQLPRTHAEIFTLTRRMAQAALGGTPLRPLANAPETAPFLADTRYVLATVAAPAGTPLFRWQMPEHLLTVEAVQHAAIAQWRVQAKTDIAPLLPGCGIELLPPEAYYMGCREADRQIRPVSLHAAVNYLTHVLGIEPGELSAIVGGFGEEAADSRIDEYRISFIVRQQPDEVVYGVVWPLYDEEESAEEAHGPLTDYMLQADPSDKDDPKTPLEEIFALLRACGITHIKRHSEIFPADFCEDCGAPLYCDSQAELVHAEMPEDTPQVPGHFH